MIFLVVSVYNSQTPFNLRHTFDNLFEHKLLEKYV